MRQVCTAPRMPRIMGFGSIDTFNSV